MKIVLIIIILMFCIGAMAAPTKDPLANFFKGKTKIEDPFSLRDPFKANITKTEKATQKSGYYISGQGQYSNIKESVVPELENLKVVGVLIGKERRVMVTNGSSKNVVILKEGMRIGNEGAELKAIMPGGIILVERIVNVYGQDEYLETVIPISK